MYSNMESMTSESVQPRPSPTPRWLNGVSMATIRRQQYGISSTPCRIYQHQWRHNDYQWSVLGLILRYSSGEAEPVRRDALPSNARQESTNLWR